MAMRDKWTKTTFSHLCEKKGATDKWVISRLCQDIDSLGYTKIILKGDGEPALKEVQQEIKDRRKHETILVNPPAYDPQSNGAAEKAV